MTTHDYKRHGTTTLFDALNVLGRSMRRLLDNLCSGFKSTRPLRCPIAVQQLNRHGLVSL